MKRTALSAAALLLCLAAPTQVLAQAGPLYVGTLPSNLVGNLGNFFGVKFAPKFAAGDVNAGSRIFTGYFERFTGKNIGFNPPLLALGSGQLPGLASLPTLDGPAFMISNALNAAVAPYANNPTLQKFIGMTSSGPLAIPDINGQFAAARARLPAIPLLPAPASTPY